MAKTIEPNLHLYRLTQYELIHHIKALLDKRQIPYTEYKGNIVSIRYPERPMFVAHMDTVGTRDCLNKLRYANGILKRKRPAILGADDRAGVDILLNHIDDINFTFTVDEEIGALGAKYLASLPSFVAEISQLPCAIEYDRRGSSDLIMYCDYDLVDDIENLTHYKETDGLFTDIAIWEDFIPAVNLSCGYYKAHTSSEYLNIAQWRDALATVPILNEHIRGQYEIPIKKPTTTYPYHDYGEFNFYDDYDDPYPFTKMCNNCGCAGTTLYEIPGKEIICEHCLYENFGITRVS